MKKANLYLSTVDENAPVLARKYGLGLELSEFCTAWNLDDEFPETDRVVRREMEGISRFTLHGPFNELFPCAVDRKVRALTRQRYLQAIEIAKGYGIHKLVLHAGYNPWLFYPVWFREQSILFFRDFVKEIPEDMTVCLENVLEDEPSMMTDILRSVDSPRLRMCLDVGHAHAYSKVGVETWILKCQDVLSHFHVHNNDGTRDSHSALFEGSIPMESLFREIENLCPQATVTLELPDASGSLAWMAARNLLEEET